jgi:hypothetical protein
MTITHVLETADVDIAYDVRGPLPTADGRPPLFMIGQPMDASGFATLASYFPDRSLLHWRRGGSPDPGWIRVGTGQRYRASSSNAMRTRSRKSRSAVIA